MQASDVDYLNNILLGIVGSPDELKIDRSVDDGGTLLSVSVAQSDMGRVIGKEGQTAKAIRTLINCFAMVGATNKIHVKFLEPINNNQ